jgi:peptidoglycan hydrolase-like amidase
MPHPAHARAARPPLRALRRLGCALGLAVGQLTGCVHGSAFLTAAPPSSAAPAQEPEPARAPILAPAAASSAVLPAAAASAARALPALDHEPLLAVLIARAPRVAIRLESRARLEAPGLATTVGPGTLTVEATASGWRLAGSTLGASAPGVLRSEGRPIFSVDAIPRFGNPRALQLAGDLVLTAAGGEVEVIERVRMEDYLASVVGAEMNPKWPAAALAAQAIVARSYASARWMERERAGEAWHLHWHFGVDMAYHGWSAGLAPVTAAIAPTRGEVLMHRGFPVLALFHASSGGRTESFERIKPGVLAPDGKTPIAPAMPVVDDDAAEPGAAGLGLAASHGRWKTDIPLPEVTETLRQWSAAARGRPAFGTVEAVSIAARHADSGRVASVSIRHHLDGATRFTTLPATDFRMAIGPVRVRSVLWDRCVIASKAPGYLVLEGRGFGHGCGLSQVSAWHLARQGASPEAIVARFYAGAEIERRY